MIDQNNNMERGYIFLRTDVRMGAYINFFAELMFLKCFSKLM